MLATIIGQLNISLTLQTSIMYKKIANTLLLIFLIAAFSSAAQNGIDKKAYYNAFSSFNSGLIDGQLNAVKSISGTDKEAFEGAMLMRKAGTLSVPAKKLSSFKQGHKKLENAIAGNPSNPEYRFLRLLVQENAPRSLGYYKNIEQDSKFIKDNYKSLPLATQQALTNYSKKSNALAGAF